MEVLDGFGTFSPCETYLLFATMLRTAIQRNATVLRRTALVGLVGVGGGVTYLVTSDNTTVRGLRRQATFWSRVVPIIGDYYWNFGASSPKVKYQEWWTERVISKQGGSSLSSTDTTTATTRSAPASFSACERESSARTSCTAARPSSGGDPRRLRMPGSAKKFLTGVAAVLAAGTLIGWLYGRAELGLLAAALIVLIWQIRQLLAFNRALQTGDFDSFRYGEGIWQQMFSRFSFEHDRGSRQCWPICLGQCLVEYQ